MPVQPTYPGVYIEEIPSGVHTITGVATSITAFMGRALQGPVNIARTIESYADYERIFGGLWLDSKMSYAVRDFYLNGGSTAVIVRLFYPTEADMKEQNDTAQLVANAQDTTNPPTLQSLAAAMRQIANEATSRGGQEAGDQVATAAETEAKRTVTVDTVRNAAQTAADAINKAAQDVANAQDPTSPSTPQSLAAAMRAEANNATADPGKTIADLVAKAAETAAANAGAKVDDVKKAAKDAVDAITKATQAVASAQDTTKPSTPQSLAAAIRTEAKKSTQDPAKTAADLVATAAEAESTNTPSLPSVQKAASDAAAAVQANAPVTRSNLSVGGLSFEAAYEGSWGENLRAALDFNVLKEVADDMGLKTTDLFNLFVRDTSPGGLTEQFRNLSLIDSPKGASRRIDTILKAQSKLMRWGGGGSPVATDIQSLNTARQQSLSTNGRIMDDVSTAELAALLTTKTLTKQLRDDKSTKKADAVIQVDLKALEDAQKPVIDAKKKMQASNGSPIHLLNFIQPGNDVNKLGLYALEQVDLFNLLCIPPYLVSSDDVDVELVSEAAAYCEKRRAMLLVDPPSTWTDKATAKDQFTDPIIDNVGTRSKNAALFFPRLSQPNLLRNNQIEDFVPCGLVAGIFARTDTQRGVWKAPAGLEASLVGVPQLSVNLTDLENGELNPLGINCLRAFPIYGRVVWGSRTLRGADQFADEYKYIPVRRTALFIEESLYRGTQWVVFEPNDEPLWAQIRLNIGAFMHNLFRQGAFQGKTPSQAYFVKCDSETTTATDQNNGIVNILVGFAPLKRAEFVIIQIQQMAGQT